MDNLNKHSKRRQPVNSIDGVSHSRRPLPSDGGRIRGSNAGRSRRRLDDFNHKDSFRPASANVISTPLTEAPKRAPSTSKTGENLLDGTVRSRGRAKKGKVFKTFAVLASFVVLSGGFLFAKGYIGLHNVLGGSGGAAALQQNVDPSLLTGEGDGRINILIAGRGGASHEAPDLTDTLILASIDPVAKEAGLVSIPRDFYAEVPDYGAMKINEVFYTGKSAYLTNNQGNGKDVTKQAEESGMKLLDSTVSEILGVPVHYHAIVDFTGFKKAVNTVGGVDLNVPSPVFEHMRIEGKPYTLDVKKGQQHFDGFEALAYSRSRYTSPRGDFDRSERQRLIILALKEKIFSLGTYSNPVKIAGLVDDLGGHVRTNFSLDDIKQMYEISTAINSGKVISVGLVDAPNNFITTGNIGGASVVLPTAGVGNYGEIHNYVRNVIRDSFIRQENPNILVLNGTNDTGAATAKAEELRSYGYNVIVTGDAPSRSYTRNVLVDLKNGENKYTKRYLELRLDTNAVSSLPDDSINTENADFVIIVGE